MARNGYLFCAFSSMFGGKLLKRRGRDKGRPKVVFINAPLSTMAEGNLNAEIDRLVRKVGLRTYLPQTHIPPGSNVDSLKVFKANVAAVRKSNVVLTVL